MHRCGSRRVRRKGQQRSTSEATASCEAQLASLSIQLTGGRPQQLIAVHADHLAADILAIGSRTPIWYLRRQGSVWIETGRLSRPTGPARTHAGEPPSSFRGALFPDITTVAGAQSSRRPP